VTDNDPRLIAADDVEFRTTVLVKLAEIGRDVTHVKGTCDETKEALATHIEHDNERFGKVDKHFGTVNQKIGDNSSNIAKGWGIVAAIVFMIGVIFSIIQLVKP
jgi:hypothetical protein